MTNLPIIQLFVVLHFFVTHTGRRGEPGPPGQGIQGNPGPPGVVIYVEDPSVAVPGFFRLPLTNPGVAVSQSPPAGVPQPAGPPGSVFTLGPPGGSFRQGPKGPPSGAVVLGTHRQTSRSKVSEQPVNLHGDPGTQQSYRQRNMVKKVCVKSDKIPQPTRGRKMDIMI